jgi:Domain of unknown function (DUF4381)
MNPIDPSQLPLRDIHLPGPVSWWPPAPGWWIVAAILVAAAAYTVYRYRRQFRERAARKGLKSALAALEKGSEPVQCLQRISMVMRRFAMSVADDRSGVAGLTGESWLAYLDSRWDRDAFRRGAGRALIVGPYAPADRVMYGDVQELGDLCVEWLSTQRAGD